PAQPQRGHPAGLDRLGSRRGARRCLSVLRPWLLQARQCLLQGLGRDRAGARDLPRLDAPERHCQGLRPFTAICAEGSVTKVSPLPYTPTEIMTIAAARALRNDDVCFVGIGAPSAACNLARLTHAPNITLIYQSGTLATTPT